MSIFLGCLVNFGAITVGSLIGSLLKKGIPKRVLDILLVANSLSVIYIGIDGLGIGNSSISINALIVILAMGIGACIGELIKLDQNIDNFGSFIQRKLIKNNNDENENTFGKGFVTGTLLFCVGAMAINGALQSAQGVHSILYAKSILDGITSMILASTLGIGVILSALSTFIYQGILTLVFSLVLRSVDNTSIMYQSIIAHITTVGSLIIISIGLNLLKITKIKTANLIPAMIIPIGLCPLFAIIGIL